MGRDQICPVARALRSGESAIVYQDTHGLNQADVPPPLIMTDSINRLTGLSGAVARAARRSYLLRIGNPLMISIIHFSLM